MDSERTRDFRKRHGLVIAIALRERCEVGFCRRRREVLIHPGVEPIDQRIEDPAQVQILENEILPRHLAGVEVADALDLV